MIAKLDPQEPAASPSAQPDTRAMRAAHRMILWRHQIPARFVLNRDAEPDLGMPVGSMAAELQRIAKRLQGEAFDSDRGVVDYSLVRESPAYAEYLRCSDRLWLFDPKTLGSREERLAFWINLYNALVVDGVIRLGVKRSVSDVKGFFWRAAYSIHGLRYCAMDIEYGVLRANAPHPAIPGPHFARGDPRRRSSLKQLDPRVHFALVCAARSCPPISVYDAQNIDRQLDLAARAFINSGGVVINRKANLVHLSKIFQWYARDFGAWPLAMVHRRPLLKYVARYRTEPADRDLLLNGRPRVRFMPYNWSLNSALP